MVYVVANAFFYEALRLDLPSEVDIAVRETLSIYAENYDVSIPFQSGGYVIIVTDKAEYEATLEQVNTSSDMAEFSEIVVKTKEGIWKQEYYQLATEYGVSVFFYEPKGE